jgi:hypothetical protein
MVQDSKAFGKSENLSIYESQRDHFKYHGFPRITMKNFISSIHILND